MRNLQAPPGLSAMSPFTRSGEMTAHDWVVFTRVYGQWLLSQNFEGASLALLLTLLNLIKLCISNTVTPALMLVIRAEVKTLSNAFTVLLPSTEKAIVFHLLAFHIPDTIALWGPARGHWCFPFERSDAACG